MSMKIVIRERRAAVLRRTAVDPKMMIADLRKRAVNLKTRGAVLKTTVAGVSLSEPGEAAVVEEVLWKSVCP